MEPTDLDESATVKNLRPALHALFRNVAPEGSKLKEQYHWRNLRSSLLACAEDDDTVSSIAMQYSCYYLNFGRKFMLIEQLSPLAPTDGSTARELFPTSLTLDRVSLLHDEAPEAQERQLEVVGAIGGGAADTAFVLRESVATFAFETPDRGYVDVTVVCPTIKSELQFKYCGEAKIWKGPKYCIDGFKQLDGYLTGGHPGAFMLFYFRTKTCDDLFANFVSELISDQGGTVLAQEPRFASTKHLHSSTAMIEVDHFAAHMPKAATVKS